MSPVPVQEACWGDCVDTRRDCLGRVSCCFPQVVQLKAAFQQHIREAEALKLELGRAEETLHAATGWAGMGFW